MPTLHLDQVPDYDNAEYGDVPDGGRVGETLAVLLLVLCSVKKCVYLYELSQHAWKRSTAWGGPGFLPNTITLKVVSSLPY
jgi:hypothetical protein